MPTPENTATEPRIPLKERLTPGILQALAERKCLGKDVAKVLGVSDKHLSHTLRMIGLQKIPAPTMEQKRNSKERKIARTQYRAELARRVHDKELTAKAAAKAANCSIRTIYRYLELIDEPSR